MRLLKIFKKIRIIQHESINNHHAFDKQRWIFPQKAKKKFPFVDIRSVRERKIVKSTIIANLFAFGCKKVTNIYMQYAYSISNIE